MPKTPGPVEMLRAAAAKLLEWWPEGSENGTAAKRYGDGFAGDLNDLRAALHAETEE